jgi:hypothetical protein
MWMAAVNAGSKQLPERREKNLALKVTSFYRNED